MNTIDLLGYAAAFCTSFSFIPQVYKIIKTGDTTGISLSMYTIYVTGIVLWLLFGLAMHSLPVIGANVFTLLLSGTVLILKLMDKKGNL